MELQRYDAWSRVGAVYEVESCDGRYYRAADVDRLLADIRDEVRGLDLLWERTALRLANEDTDKLGQAQPDTMTSIYYTLSDLLGVEWG